MVRLQQDRDRRHRHRLRHHPTCHSRVTGSAGSCRRGGQMHQPCACLGAVVALCSARRPRLSTWRPGPGSRHRRLAWLWFGQDAGKYPVACGLDVRQL